MKQKKNINIIVGTNNAGKLREIKDLLPKNLIIYSPKYLKLKSPKENGASFEENSLIKSKYFSNKTKLICLADDSGLEIDLLDRAPGIYSARWAGKDGNFSKAIKKVYKELTKKDRKWKSKKIKARFVCALSISSLNKKIVCVRGKVEGIISLKPKGKTNYKFTQDRKDDQEVEVTKDYADSEDKDASWLKKLSQS